MIPRPKRLLKNFDTQVLDVLPDGVGREAVDIWFQDEARIGQQNTVTRCWAQTGTRPRVVRQQQFLSAYLFGASSPATGQSAAVVMPASNTAAMIEHLKCISDQLDADKHAVIVMDRAAWHTTQKLPSFHNLSVVYLPPASPELNPMEQVWQQLRQDSLSNRCFDDYDDIVNATCDAWNQFVTDPERVKSLCHRDWAII